MVVNTSNIIVIGGGIFGITTSLILAENGYNVTIVEKNKDILTGASLINQNRIHHGYHYPRSKQTCKESLTGLESFKSYYGDCINYNFKKYYTISKKESHVSANEFVKICDDFGLPLTESYPDESILNRKMVESCWLTNEPIFDYTELKNIVYKKLSLHKNITIIRNCTISKVENSVAILDNNYRIKFDYLVNSTYSDISNVLDKLGYEPIKSKYQLCVLPILKMSSEIEPFGVTVMDGPFCSLMPKGFEKNRYILYHVKKSVIQEHIGTKRPNWLPFKNLVEQEIIDGSMEFFPILKEMELIDSWITTRIVLPEQEFDDARPTFIRKNDHNVFTIFSGKLTTCVDAAYDLLKQIK